MNGGRLAAPSGHTARDKAISTPNLNKVKAGSDDSFDRDPSRKSFRKFFR